ncbi:MAG TPA: hypothetical protein PKM32_02180 [Planctomycetota bacterium]|nr:hypothetical protein [Planctomycetota bacterium]
MRHFLLILADEGNVMGSFLMFFSHETSIMGNFLIFFPMDILSWEIFDGLCT